MSIASYQILYESAILYGIRKQLQAEDAREQLKKELEEKEKKNIAYRNVRNNHSRTVILSHLTDIDEKNENIEKNNNNENQIVKATNKNVKRIIYKNENKNRKISCRYIQSR